MDVPAQEKREFTLPPPSCFIQTFSGLDDAHIGGGDLLFLSLLNQMLTSSRNILIDTPRNNVLPATWASLSPVKLTH